MRAGRILRADALAAWVARRHVCGGSPEGLHHIDRSPEGLHHIDRSPEGLYHIDGSPEARVKKSPAKSTTKKPFFFVSFVSFVVLQKPPSVSFLHTP